MLELCHGGPLIVCLKLGASVTEYLDAMLPCVHIGIMKINNDTQLWRSSWSKG